MKKIVLPNGITMAAFNKLEADVLYHEIFATNTYFRHGISVSEGDVIFDVGANIGMFSVCMARRFKRLTIHAFEPVEDMFRFLEHNCLNNIDGHTAVHLHPYGLSDTNKSAGFQFSRAFSLTSGMYATQLEEDLKSSGSIFKWLKAIAHDLTLIGKISGTSRRVISAVLSVPFINMGVALLCILPLLVLLLKVRLKEKKVSCRLRSLRDVLKEQEIGTVHLVKIDVEGSEGDVLNGIGDQDWKKIRQLVIEVHDMDNRVDVLSAMLREKGYTVVADQEDWHLHRLMKIYTLYARRTDDIPQERKRAEK